MEIAKDTVIYEEATRAASMIKLVTGVSMGATMTIILDAYSEVKKAKWFKNNVKLAFNQAIKERKNYEFNLVHPSEGSPRFFHLDDLSPRLRKKYGDISDRDYYEMWISVGNTPYNKSLPLVKCLANKFKVTMVRHKVDERIADIVQWPMVAQAALVICCEIYDNAIFDCSKSYATLSHQILSYNFKAFRPTRLLKAWQHAMSLCPVGVFDLEPFEERNIDVSMKQICDMWMDPTMLHDSLVDAVEDFDDVFRTPGEQKKTLRELDDFGERLEDEYE